MSVGAPTSAQDAPVGGVMDSFARTLAALIRLQQVFPQMPLMWRIRLLLTPPFTVTNPRTPEAASVESRAHETAPTR